MSDGSLSTDEIDALLSQSGDGQGAGTAPQGITETQKEYIANLLDKVRDGISQTLSGLFGKTVTLSVGNGEITNKDKFIGTLPEDTVEVKLDYAGDIPGDHLYIISKDDSIKIAGLMSGQDGMELDAMALTSIGEAISQVTGSLLTTVESESGKKATTGDPETQGIPKAMVRFPDGDFVVVELTLAIEDDGEITLKEIFSSSIVQGLSPAPVAASPNNPVQPQGQMGNQPMMDGQGMQQQNVQGVQYPSLNQVDLNGVSQRNIGLLMDVSMDLTVELGRTKWQIKEILGIGEGTIIELDKLAGEAVDILVNKNLIARGEVVVIDENFGVRVTDIVTTGAKLIED